MTVGYESYLSDLGISEFDTQLFMAHSGVAPHCKELDHEVAIAASSIHGLGIFSVDCLDVGESVAYMVKDGERRVAVRYTNHADMPNCIAVIDRNNDIILVPLLEIDKDTELTVDYRQVMTLADRLHDS